MSGPTRSPGDVVEAQCTRCRTLTNHIIVALVEGRIARVQCNTCGGSHNYRPPAAPSKPRRAAAVPKAAGRRPAGRASSRETSDLLAWQQACSSADPAQAVAYAMDRTFAVGALVAHPAFGLGVVTILLPPNKVEILFQAGRKLLRCAT